MSSLVSKQMCCMHPKMLRLLGCFRGERNRVSQLEFGRAGAG